ncbi:MAG: hypothetical protein H6779_00680 [Candidatus Nomurabacteria bacterium]|nr:hypothetical protein [Candidatus Nomurabacteria bacterium]USN87945.1 MAG: hypothetical protein H6779_00680 [Candidatus Nomurabacteria bacterium]
MADFFKTIFGAMAGPLFFFVGLYIIYKTFSVMGVQFAPVISIILALTPILLPVALFYITYDEWIKYVRLKFVINNGRSTLRIHLPQEVLKSPEAMESVMSQIHAGNYPDNLMESYLSGKHALPFSFELASIGGEVRFYINVPTVKIKNAVEAQLYAQYPGIEVVEEQLDYTDEIVWDPEKYEMIVFHMGKKEDEVLPIKTYIDYGLDKMPKEEEKFEPMAPMIELLGKAKPHDRIWVQFLAIPHVKKDLKSGYRYSSGTWEAKAVDKVNEIMQRNKKVAFDQDEGERQVMLTAGEKDKIAAIERNVGKYAYEVGIRWIYLAEKGKFDGQMIGPLIRTFSQYDILNRNGVGVRWRSDFDYKFISDFTGSRLRRWRKEEVKEYKLREYTTRDKKKFVDKMKVMSVEELATMFHIPGRAVVTPTMPRIVSTRKEAPSNLPTGIMTDI